MIPMPNNHQNTLKHPEEEEFSKPWVFFLNSPRIVLVVSQIEETLRKRYRTRGGRGQQS